MTSNDKIIILNVSGIKYETRKATLAKYPNTRLGEMVNGNHKSCLTNKNEYFIDRNGYAFRYVLEYYRTGQILWTTSNEPGGCYNGVSRKEMILELEYFQIPNNLKQEQEKDDKEYDLNVVRDLIINEMSNATFSSVTPSTNTRPSTIDTTPQTYSVPNNDGNNELVRLNRWTTFEEHAQIVDSFIIALKHVIYEIHRNFRRQVNFFFHYRLPVNEVQNHNTFSSIYVDLDLDSIREIMKPFRISGYRLLEWYGSDIEKKLKGDFEDTITFETCKNNGHIGLTITILTPFNNQYILFKSCLVRR
ncbi:5898_t:CDS:2 [Funneliformis geosporum]|uniref:2085_t:CDS:1 n=1 Tax=Funneliformis geosporum TaxID=1117311 RepID=A0A9W4SJW7_9GLOM|nr:2085_t:CDS:2 [Funneliformis geosporum]CAI2174990.1 5898_t:CDS:2 [Funneliformis geosporum]